MDKIKLKDVNFDSFEMLAQQGTKSSIYRNGNRCIKMLDRLYDDEREDVFRKFLDMEGIEIDGVILPKELIVDEGKLKGYTMDYFSAIPLTDKFSVRYVDTKELFDYIFKASKILREIHRNDIICQDLSFENILVDVDGNIKFCDLDGCSYKGSHSPFISVIMKRFFLDYRKEQMRLEPNLDRISMMLSFFFLMYAKEIQRLSKKEYHKLSDRIITLDKMKDYANRLVDKKCNIGEIPYLDEIISLDDNVVYDRDKQLSLFRRIFR